VKQQQHRDNNAKKHQCNSKNDEDEDDKDDEILEELQNMYQPPSKQ